MTAQRPAASRRLRATILGVFITAWGLGLAREAASLVLQLRRSPWSDDDPAPWRLGTAPATRLERFLAAVGRKIPDGSRIAFSSRPGGQASLLHALWAGYLWPQYTVRLAVDEGTLERSDFWVAYLTTVHHPRAHQLLAVDDGVLYRLTPLSGEERPGNRR